VRRLAVVATGEEDQLVLIALADRTQPVGGELHRLVPLDLDKLATAALAHTLQRFLQPRRRVVLHDPGRALGAEHALVHRMIGIALDVAQAAVLDVDADAAAAGAHVAGGGLDAVAHRLAEIEFRVSHGGIGGVGAKGSPDCTGRVAPGHTVATTRTSATAMLGAGQPVIQLAVDAVPGLLRGDGVAHVAADVRTGIGSAEADEAQHELHALVRTR